MLKNKIIVRKIRNIIILLMALIIMIGTYYNIGRSRAENVIEIYAIALDNYGYLENEIFKIEATEIDENTYEVELPESVNSKAINQIVKVTLGELIKEVESENAVHENALIENEIEGNTTTVEGTTAENTTVETETPTENATATQNTVTEAETTTVEEEIQSTTSSTETIPEETSTLEIIENRIYLSKEQIENKQLNIEVVYDVAILETNEQGEFSKNILTEKTEEERQQIEITEETEMLYSKILKYEDEENGKLVEVKGYLPESAELKVEEVSEEQIKEIFGDSKIDVAYDIKILKKIVTKTLINETDPTKGTTEIIDIIEINPEDFGENCEVSITDINIEEEAQVYHVNENDNTYEKVNVIENKEGSVSFEAQSFSIYAVGSDITVEDDSGTMLGATSITFSPSTRTYTVGDKISVYVECSNGISGYNWSSLSENSNWIQWSRYINQRNSDTYAF